ncbi:radical SAM protein (plasmid) [Rhizobium sp. CB3171]|uniref:radical SAM/SPASM domain-containing protein n=1 Tax=Rhizobium sp. CB3171 TaxID=3039157 RepID=UPI0024B10A13|nr:radical SAM protein [Rhizobium sp. CB3171]WFU06787.1 radical SAM protein [Rhizobium sp. CB3171]
MTLTRNWKQSSFNVPLGRSNNMTLLFNTRSGQTLEFDRTEWAAIQRCFDSLEHKDPAPDRELVSCLATLGFVVPADLDEFREEEERLHHSKLDDSRLFITIAPTMACNQHCSYCFQQNTPKTRIMSARMQQATIEFVRRKIGNSRHLVVQWFGGEPLVAYAAITFMTRAFKAICAELGVHYYAEMLTNGVLLTPKRVAALSQLCVKALQISLDGTPETYSARRQVPITKAEAHYHYLTEHLQDIVEATGSVTIRINVDRENIEEAKYVVRRFKRHGFVDRRIDFRLGFINTSRGLVDCVPHDCFTNTEFAQQEVAFRRFLESEGCMVYGMPRRKLYPCTAVVRNSFTIDPNGNLGKCVPTMGTPQSSFALILPDDMDRTMRDVETAEMPFERFNPFSSEGCRGCRMLPACLGSCPKHHAEGRRVMACSMQEGLADKIAFYHSFHRGLDNQAQA